MKRLLRLVAVVLLAVVSLSGCEFKGLLSLPLPGGPSGPTYQVDVLLSDALDLVPHAAVKVHDVTVGEVDAVDLRGYTAVARCSIKSSVHLPANAVATLRQTSLLGEKFLALSAPQGVAATGSLADGATIPLSRTSVDVEVEDVLSATSALLNGGGLAQIQTIASQLSTMLDGREGDARDLLVQLDTLVGGLDAQRGQIVRAIDAVDRLSSKLAAQRGAIGETIDKLGPGVRTLADQRQALTTMLTSLSKLGAVGTRVVEQSRASTLADLRALQPVADALAKSAADIPKFLPTLLTYPLGDAAEQALNGAYGNLQANMQLNLAELLHDLVLPDTTALLGGTPAATVPPSVQPPRAPAITAPAAPSPTPTPSKGTGPLGGLLGGLLG